MRNAVQIYTFLANKALNVSKQKKPAKAGF